MANGKRKSDIMRNKRRKVLLKDCLLLARQDSFVTFPEKTTFNMDDPQDVAEVKRFPLVLSKME